MLDRLNLYETRLAELKKDKVEQKIFDANLMNLNLDIKNMKEKIDNTLNHFMNTENYVGKYTPVQIHY